jgi:hypothetical protein
MTFDIGIRYYTRYRVFWNSISNALNLENTDIEGRHIPYRSSTISKNIRYRIMKDRYRLSTISKKRRYRTSISVYPDIEDFSISTNGPSISVYDIEVFLLRYRISCSSISVFLCRIQPGPPTRYRTQIAVCTLHCKLIRVITRGSCAARAALSRSSGGCTRRRGRTRCTGRSTGRSRRSGARPPERRPPPSERASTERRSA